MFNNFSHEFKTLKIFFCVQDNGNRFFMLLKPGGFDEIGLSAKAVKGSIKMNTTHRHKPFDSLFLKALLVGFCSMKGIKEGVIIQAVLMEIIKG